MSEFIARRILTMFVVLIIISFVIFGLVHLIPGDPALAVLGEHARPEDIQRVRQQLGLDKPLLQQYLTWVRNVVTGDLGRSFISNEPVAGLIKQRMPATVQLTLGALLLGGTIGVLSGTLAGSRPNSLVDVLVTSASVAGVAMPHFWLGILLILLFGLTLRWLPSSGYVPLQAGLVENMRSILLPTLTISVGLMATVARQTRSSILEVRLEDFIRTARAKGLSEPTILRKHTLRNALLPVLTVTGMQVGRLVSGAVITERIFSIPGLGRLMVDAVMSRDIPVVQSTILLATLLVLVTNLMVDVLYLVVDPRVRYE